MGSASCLPFSQTRVPAWALCLASAANGSGTEQTTVQGLSNQLLLKWWGDWLWGGGRRHCLGHRLGPGRAQGAPSLPHGWFKACPSAPSPPCRPPGMLCVWRCGHAGVLRVLQGQDVCGRGPEAVLRLLLQTGTALALVGSVGGTPGAPSPLLGVLERSRSGGAW